MRLAAKARSKAELARIIGVKPQSINTAITRGKIPDRWFLIMEEKFGATREELCRPPAKVQATIEQQYNVDAGLPPAIKLLLEWYEDQDELARAELHMHLVEGVPGFGDWIKKQKGGGHKDTGSENIIADGTDG